MLYFAFREDVGPSPTPAAQTPEGADVISQSYSLGSQLPALVMVTSFHNLGEEICHVALSRALPFQAGHSEGAGAFQFFLQLNLASCIG